MRPEAQDKDEERHELTWCADPEGVGCAEVVVATLASCGAIIWGLMRLARWC